MPAQGTSARPWSGRIMYALLYAVALQWSLPSHAEEQRSTSEHRVVYRCLRDDVLTLTDVPCNGDRVDIDLNRNLSVARPVIRTVPKNVRTPKHQPSAAITEQQRKAQQARCDHLRAQLDTLQSKLRSGYTAAAGIRLEEKRRQLREAQSTKCPA